MTIFRRRTLSPKNILRRGFQALRPLMSWVKSVAGDDEFDLHFDCVTFYLTIDGLWVVIGDVPQTRNVVKCLLLTKSRWSVVTLYGSCSLCLLRQGWRVKNPILTSLRQGFCRVLSAQWYSLEWKCFYLYFFFFFTNFYRLKVFHSRKSQHYYNRFRFFSCSRYSARALLLCLAQILALMSFSSS